MRFLYAWKNQVLYKTVGTIKYIVAFFNKFARAGTEYEPHIGIYKDKGHYGYDT